MSGLARLWAGWRSTYLEEVVAAPSAGGDCLFCALAAGDPDEMLVLARSDRAFAAMNAFPYTSGHVMVAPLAHEGNLDGLDHEDADALMGMTQDACRALRSAYSPEGINVGVNMGRAAGAGVPAHVHVHVLPRWNGDTNFMTSVAETRVLPEALRDSWKKLRESWPPDRLGSGSQ